MEIRLLPQCPKVINAVMDPILKGLRRYTRVIIRSCGFLAVVFLHLHLHYVYKHHIPGGFSRAKRTQLSCCESPHCCRRPLQCSELWRNSRIYHARYDDTRPPVGQPCTRVHVPLRHAARSLVLASEQPSAPQYYTAPRSAYSWIRGIVDSRTWPPAVTGAAGRHLWHLRQRLPASDSSGSGLSHRFRNCSLAASISVAKSLCARRQITPAPSVPR